ncbi:hypothetical protein HPP92_028875 [Vanilla planifolia]|uniref:Uncharacterized protein n=1 Tax=Vanilla planifolia TaxID=51239 RepID=A0A835P611_VANPL|nr:hypothetical protein HPP92_028875 [Vanilla planifolia]KAG0446362.1 hypothetical protein HPP92_028864 [Vanilla planifolia]
MALGNRGLVTEQLAETNCVPIARDYTLSSHCVSHYTDLLDHPGSRSTHLDLAKH